MNKAERTTIYYHFLREDRCLGFGDGRKVRVGETLTVDGEPIPCRYGLHASRRIADALTYAPSSILSKVRLGGKVVHSDDKSVATERTTLAIADCTDILHAFARRCALDVLHLWNAPDVVVRYLHTGDESIRADAGAAASAAAWAAISDAASAATSAAASEAASAAASAAASEAASAAAWVAARAAASDAASDSAWASAKAAARDRQNRRLTQMVRHAQWEEAPDDD